jgi:hypothetical protein
MPATSPTLSPTLSAMVAGLRGIILGNAGLDLADQVGADVGRLGVDAAADAREQRDRAGTHGVAADDLGEVQELDVAMRRARRTGSTSADADHAERRHRQAHDGAAEERDAQRLALPDSFAAAAVRTFAFVAAVMPKKPASTELSAPDM